MDNQERSVIDGIFQRLQGAASQPRDPEAERYITDKIQKQPYAPYAMAQSLFIQEQALTNLQAQVEQAAAGQCAPQPALRRLPVKPVRWCSCTAPAADAAPHG